jgi:hypothetical protein
LRKETNYRSTRHCKVQFAPKILAIGGLFRLPTTRIIERLDERPGGDAPGLRSFGTVTTLRFEGKTVLNLLLAQFDYFS